MAVRFAPAAGPTAAVVRPRPRVADQVSRQSGVMVPRTGSPPPRILFGQRLELAEGAKDHDGLTVLVFRRGVYLVTVEIERDPGAGFARWREMQRAPIHRDLAAADAKEAAEVDDGGAHLSGAV